MSSTITAVGHIQHHRLPGWLCSCSGAFFSFLSFVCIRGHHKGRHIFPRFDRDTKEVRPEKTRAQLWLPLQYGCMYTAQAHKDGRKGTVTRHSSNTCCAKRNGSAYLCCTARDMTGLLLAGKRCTYSSVHKGLFPSRERERARPCRMLFISIYI